jgi:hypothetical protein
MNKLVREHYPASKLPKELRGDIDPTSAVTITIVEEGAAPDRSMSLEQIFERTKEFRRLSAEQIDADIRALRDEWDA